MTTTKLRAIHWLPVGLCAFLLLGTVGVVTEQRESEQRTEGMAEAYAAYQQATPYTGSLAVGAGELVVKVCQARDSAYSSSLAMGQGSRAAAVAGHENAVDMALALMGTRDRDAATRVVRGAEKVCDN